jgi:hypothetical protein
MGQDKRLGKLGLDLSYQFDSADREPILDNVFIA